MEESEDAEDAEVHGEEDQERKVMVRVTLIFIGMYSLSILYVFILK
jgi:hypothetical protein